MKKRYSKNKNSFKTLIAVAFVASAAFGGLYYFLNKTNERVIAKVNGKEILESEFKSKLHDIFAYQIQDSQIPQIDALPKEVVELLAKEIYLTKELTRSAKKSNVANNADVKARMENAKNKILLQAYIDQALADEVTEQKLNDKYAEMTNDLSGKKEYLTYQFSVANKSEAENLAKVLKSKLSKDKFDALAKKHSASPTYNYAQDFGKSAELVSAAKTGDVVGPIEEKNRWYVIKITSMRDAVVPSFEDIKENIKENLKSAKIMEMNSQITKDANVEILVSLKTEESVKKEEVKTEENKSEVAVEEKPAQVEESAKAEDAAAAKTEEVKKEETKAEVKKADSKKKKHESKKSEVKKDSHKKVKHKESKSE